MKKLIAILALVSAAAVAGPLKVATYPLVHPKKDVHAAKAFFKGAFKVGKAVLW